MVDPTLLPDPTCLHLLQLEVEGKVITATMKTTAPEARCPLCAGQSEQVHSRYRRVLADLPWMGCGVRLELHTRRFFCQNPDCQRKIFDLPLVRRGGSFCSTHPPITGPVHPDSGFQALLDGAYQKWDKRCCSRSKGCSEYQTQSCS